MGPLCEHLTSARLTPTWWGARYPHAASHPRLTTCTLLALLLCFWATDVPAEKPLILAVHPYLDYREVVARYSPLAEYLSRELGQEVVVRVGKDYKEHIGYIGRDVVDMAFLGPASYVKMTTVYGPKPLLARLEIRGRPVFRGKIVVRKDSDIDTLGQLKGKRFAFGDPASTMSHLVPRLMLHEAGVAGEDLGGFQFLGSHRNVAFGVLAGDFDAGAVKEEIYYRLQGQGLKAIATTPALSEHLFVARAGLPIQTVDAIRDALYWLQDTPEGQAIMRGIKKDMSAMVPVEDSDYDNLRRMLGDLERLGVNP